MIRLIHGRWPSARENGAMRLRSVVLSVAVACAAAVAVPSSAVAGSEQCTLVMPTKVVVDARSEKIPVRFGSNCDRSGAVAADWVVAHSSGEYWDAYFDETYYTPWLTQMDDDAMGRYVGYRAGAYTAGAWAADEPDLTQNQPVMHVKYASRLATKVTRTSTKLTWAVTATQWSGRSHRYVPRPKVTVGLFHRATTASPWKYVKSVTTTSTGKATVTLSGYKPGAYRLKVAETPTVWASYSAGIPGRI
jgi:hypothetical protein